MWWEYDVSWCINLFLKFHGQSASGKSPTKNRFQIHVCHHFRMLYYVLRYFPHVSVNQISRQSDSGLTSGEQSPNSQRRKDDHEAHVTWEKWQWVKHFLTGRIDDLYFVVSVTCPDMFKMVDIPCRIRNSLNEIPGIFVKKGLKTHVILEELVFLYIWPLYHQDPLHLFIFDHCTIRIRCISLHLITSPSWPAVFLHIWQLHHQDQLHFLTFDYCTIMTRCISLHLTIAPGFAAFPYIDHFTIRIRCISTHLTTAPVHQNQLHFCAFYHCTIRISCIYLHLYLCHCTIRIHCIFYICVTVPSGSTAFPYIWSLDHQDSLYFLTFDRCSIRIRWMHHQDPLNAPSWSAAFLYIWPLNHQDSLHSFTFDHWIIRIRCIPLHLTIESWFHYIWPLHHQDPLPFFILDHFSIRILKLKWTSRNLLTEFKEVACCVFDRRGKIGRRSKSYFTGHQEFSWTCWWTCSNVCVPVGWVIDS
jgi:hypothetical protein